MHPESFAHEQNIPASHKNVPEYLECTQKQSEFLECTPIIKERTIYGIPAHSGSRVTRVLVTASRNNWKNVNTRNVRWYGIGQ